MPTVTVDFLAALQIASTVRATVTDRLQIIASLRQDFFERIEEGGSGTTARFPLEWQRDLFTLPLTPDKTSYGAADTAESNSQALQGGLSRNRRDKIGSSVIIDCTWTLSGDDYETLFAFYSARVNSLDDLPFTANLIVDQPELTAHIARFMPGTFSLVGQAGDTFSVQAQLEVTPLTPVAEYDASFVAVYGEYLDNRFLTPAALATFVNTTLDVF